MHVFAPFFSHFILVFSNRGTFFVWLPELYDNFMTYIFFFKSVSRYEIMFNCWRADPLDRPLFPQLREMLEKVAEKLPESFSRDDIIYINTSFPEEDPDGQMLPAELPLFHSSPSCSRQAAENSVVTADVHESLEDEEEGDDNRYVVVIACDRSMRCPAADTPLLSGVTSHQGNGNVANHNLTDAAAQDHSSSDTSFLLWKLVPAEPEQRIVLKKKKNLGRLVQKPECLIALGAPWCGLFDFLHSS